jgi:hypothetical protein
MGRAHFSDCVATRNRRQGWHSAEHSTAQYKGPWGKQCPHRRSEGATRRRCFARKHRYDDRPMDEVSGRTLRQSTDAARDGGTPIAGQAISYNPRAATEFNNPSTTCPSFNINAFANSVSTTSTSLCQNGNGGTQPVNNIRTFHSQYSNLRNDALNDWDASILKNFNITESSFFQFRLEGFNVNNRPVFSGPNLTATSGSFGQITGTQNSNRIVQLGGRFVF